MELKQLIIDLNGPGEGERLYAAEDLGTLNDAAAVTALASRLSLEPSRAVKEAIFAALSRIGDGSVLKTAIALITADDAFVRNAAVQLLGTRGAEAMAELELAVRSKDCDVRKLALDAIAMIDTERNEAIYREVLCDEDINLVITAVEHIGCANKKGLKANVEAVLEQATHPMLIAACVETLGQIGDLRSLDAAYRKLGAGEMPEFMAQCFIHAVGSLGTDDHVDLLCNLVQRFPMTLVEAGLDAIEAIRGRVVLQEAPVTLLDAVRSVVANCPMSLSRYKAVRVLGAFVDEHSRVSICQYIDSPDKMVRLAAVESIAHWHPTSAKRPLASRLLVETDEDVLVVIQDAIHRQSRSAA